MEREEHQEIDGSAVFFPVRLSALMPAWLQPTFCGCLNCSLGKHTGQLAGLLPRSWEGVAVGRREGQSSV
jgi:hypothetical protein